ncbi:GINS complex subunit [Leucoagaricus gongylophorus]
MKDMHQTFCQHRKHSYPQYSTISRGRQSEAVQTLHGDPSASESEHLRITLVQLDIERVKFIVRSYVRTRLYKIEKYARYITSSPSIQTRLTAAERDHASRHADLNDRHFSFSVLQSLPEPQRHLDDEVPYYMPSMVMTPDVTRPVFVHALQDCPPVVLPDGTRHEMTKGHVSLTHFSVVEHLVARGEAELV